MVISRKQTLFLLAGMIFGSAQTFGICYGWYKATQSSSPQAIIDTSQGGETIVRYVGGKPMELVFKPAPPEKNGKLVGKK